MSNIRVKPVSQTYKAGDKFIDECGNEFLLCVKQDLDYVDPHIIYDFQLLSLPKGKFIGYNFVTPNKEYLTEEQFEFLSNKEINTLKLTKIN